MHSDKSASNICKLRQWRSQQPSYLAYIVLDDRLLVIDCNVICECSVTATREGSLLVQLKQPATQILKAPLLQQRRRDRPLGALCHSQVSVDTEFVTIQVNSISEMNAAFQFALARSSGHSEGCHHIRLLQGFTKFQFQLLFSSFCSKQPSCLDYIHCTG